MLRFAFVIALITAAAPSWAVNKCTAADGSVTFQEAPCPGSAKTKESVRVFAGGGSGSSSPSGSIPALDLKGPLSHRASVAVAALENIADLSSDCKSRLKVYGRGPEARAACLSYADHSQAWFTASIDVLNEMTNSPEFKDEAAIRRGQRYARRILDDMNFINLKLGLKTE